MSIEKSEVRKDVANEETKLASSVHLHHPEIDTSEVDERKLMRKIDWHVVPWLGVLYLLNFLDRGNVANAKVSLGARCFIFKKSLTSVYWQLYNLEKDLHISDTQYAIALTVFFFPYALLEVRRARTQLSHNVDCLFVICSPRVMHYFVSHGLPYGFLH